MIPEVLSFKMSGLSSLGDDSKCLKFKFYNLSNVPYFWFSFFVFLHVNMHSRALTISANDS